MPAEAVKVTAVHRMLSNRHRRANRKKLNLKLSRNRKRLRQRLWKNHPKPNLNGRVVNQEIQDVVDREPEAVLVREPARVSVLV